MAKLMRHALGGGFKRGHDLGEADDLLQGVPLGNALRTESDMNTAPQMLHAVVNQLGNAGINRAAQDQQRAVPHVAQRAIDAAVEVIDFRVEVAVNGRANHGDDHVRGGQAFCAGGRGDAIPGQLLQ
jgi:hypothetical protein